MDKKMLKKSIMDAIESLDESMDGYTFEDRVEILSAFCRHCGLKSPNCQCDNDD